MRKIENMDIENNIEFFLKWGNNTKVISFVLNSLICCFQISLLH